MADQTQRLEIATVRAEVGSNIVFRFANDAANADRIPTQSGDIQNLKQVLLEIHQDAAEKISISTTIYPTVAAGLAATVNQGIFLVQSNDADEIYTVWQNQAGTAVNTGKTALSATAIEEALQASSEAARAAEESADIAMGRTARYLAPSATPPSVRDDGLPLQIGDVWFNTAEESDYRYTTQGWAANESQQAIADLRNSQDPVKGAKGVGYRGETVADALDFSQRALGQNNHLREVYAVLPLFFPDYMDILTEAGYNNSTGSIGPGAFTVDETAREIIVACGTSWQAFTVITIYDLDSQAYKGHFKVVHATPEGIEVLYDYGGRKLFVSPADTGNLYAYDIAGISYSGQMLNHVSSHPVGVYCQFSYRKGRWLIEEASREVGRYLGRNVHAIFDKDFQRIGSFVTDIRNTGYITSSTNEMAPYLNKRQGFCLGDGFVVCSYGGAHDGEGSSLPNQHQGTRILSMDGQRVQESLLEPLAFKSLLTASLGNDEHYTRIENEGVRVLESGEIVALYLYKGRFSPGSKDKDGVVILKEFSNSRSAFDYRPASINKTQFSGLKAASAIFPRSTDGIYNPETGAKFTSVDQICNYMMLVQQSVFGFYAPSLAIKDYDDNFISSGYYRITNVDGSTFTVEVLNPSVNPAMSWSITTAGGVRSKGPLSAGVSGLLIKNSLLDQTTKFNRITAGHYLNAEENILAIDVQSNSSANTIVIGGGSSLYNAATSVLLATAPNYNTLAGSVRWGLYDTTFRPAADNSYALGSTQFRISQIFSGTTQISSSDEDMKFNIVSIRDEVLDAWSDVDYLQYQFKDALELKGTARIHFGVVAQRVERVFLEHRLDARDLGLLCYDEWEETEELVESWDAEYDELGNLTKAAGFRVVQPHIPAGSRYGIRYEEALVLEAALSRRSARRLEDRISALESKFNLGSESK